MGTPENSTPDNFIDAHSGELVLLGADDIRSVLTPALCLAALEEAYRNLHDAPDDIGQSIGFQTGSGKFHVKAGLSPATHKYFAAKVNANFPGNPERFGAPTIRGLIVLCDCTDGRPVAILQSGELTGRRTAAATALAARHGARPDAQTLALIGCGAQARHQAEAVAGVRPIVRILAFDADRARAKAFADWTAEMLKVEALTAPDIAGAVSASDITITCTTAAQIVVTPDMVPAGCFIAAVGADNPDKQELDPELFRKARILVDDLDQCAQGGDLAHAIRAGTATVQNVAATLAGLAAGAQPGRTSKDEIVIFDSTGTGIQDVAASSAAYEAFRAHASGE